MNAIGLSLRSFLKVSLLPPVNIVWILIVGILFKSTLGWLVWVALLLLYLLSVAPVANLLARGLEVYPPVDLEACKSADAMILLGAGRPRSSPELEGYQPTPLSLERIRYTALLYRECKVPILVSGGGDRPEAQTMARVLKSDYGVDVTWIEDQSMTTMQNATNSRNVLGEGTKTVVLVTHAWHMPRSVLSFKRAGFKVLPAPTAFTWIQIPWQKLSYWIPRVRNLRVSELALHEYLGLSWYWMTSR
ncbi:YdcF family protein [Endozoicomonas arenosclerae]|uniref:YdcF family protein n=1 Tax=Endozoicomonas arenosclerae TaxID=1633495 RepID=UPI0007810F57|nr:YdcF family protein [Endozoicomonas arenosclerae]